MSQNSFNWPRLGQIAAALCFIGIIAAILFPVFQKVHEGSHRSCASNMKQLGLAFIQYTQDADEKYPQGVNAAGNGWAGQIYPFIKSTDVYHCPDDPHDGKFISYAENQNLVGQSVAVLNNPAATVALYELTTLDCDPSALETNSATGLSAPQDSTRHDNHTYTLNFGTADGHVRLLRPWQVSAGGNAEGLPQGAIIETFAAK